MRKQLVLGNAFRKEHQNLEEDDRMEFFRSRLKICFRTSCSHCGHYSNTWIYKKSFFVLTAPLDWTKAIVILSGCQHTQEFWCCLRMEAPEGEKNICFIGSNPDHVSEEINAS